MSNLTGQAPLGLKKQKAKKDEAYLQELRGRGCVVCLRFGEAQRSATTAHHTIHDRFSMAKRPDREAIPLCEGHHQGNFDTSKIAIHRRPEFWRETYGPDWSYLPKRENEDE